MKLEQTEIAVIGGGRMGRLYASILAQNPRARLAAFVTNSPNSDLTEVYGVPAYPHGDCSSLWRNHPDLSAVVVSTPEWSHVEPTLAALDRGMHVLLEKPIASTLKDSRTIVEASRRSRSIVMLCHPLRVDPRFTLMVEAVHAGKIGDICYVYARRNADLNAAQRILGRCHPAFWLTAHDTDIVCWLKQSRPAHVTARFINGPDTPTGLVADLAFEDGSRAQIENLWCSPPQSLRSNWGLFEVWGSKGKIEIRPSEQGLSIQLNDKYDLAPDTFDSPVVAGKIFGVFAFMVDTFLRSVAGECDPSLSIQDAYVTMEIADAIMRSVVDGTSVRI